MRIVLDTNCLIACLPQKSSLRKVYDAIILQKITLLVSTDILLEYEEIIGNYYSTTLGKEVVNRLISLPNIELIHPYFSWQLIKDDPDDNKFVDCALSGNADLIITNDRHFNILKDIEFPKIQHLDIRRFVDLFFNETI